MIDVLIVEDDPMVSGIHRQYLERFRDLRVTGVCRGGREALERLRAREPDLIILDVYMPVMDGMELLRQIRKLNIRSDVIMVTAANDVEKVDEALKLGIVDYLIKPFEYQRFREAIERFLKKADILGTAQTLSQVELDRLVNAGTEPMPDIGPRKGIQERTLERVRADLAEGAEDSFTCDTLSARVGLSKVTVRRYLNYLIEPGEITSTIDYETGGRPSVRYHLKTQS